MKRTNSLCLLLAIALAPACGDDGGGTPDARTNFADAAANIDATPNVDAAPTADASNIDASNIDASNIDAAPNVDATPPDAMFDAMALVGLADARAAADGATSVTISNVLVTYKKAALGGDAAGFFVQAAMTGPALFIAIDPTTLTPEPAVGDDVSFRVTSMATSGVLRQADAVADWAVNSNGNSITGLVQDVTSATDLVSAVGDYEAELIDATVTVKADFTGAGSEHMAGVVDSTGVTADTNLRVRIPTTLQDTYGFVIDCSISISSTPLWRFGAAVQLSAWNASEFTATCPAPVVVSAVAPSNTEVVVTLNRAFDAASITAVATQFTFDNGLTASAGVVSGRTITLTTSTQAAGQAYVMTIAASVLDILAGSAGGTANFNGFGTPEATCDDGIDNDSNGYIDCLDSNCSGNMVCTFLSQLYIWEIDADQASGDTMEFVEIRNMSSTPIDLTEYYIVMVNGSDDLTSAAYKLTGSLAAGALFVLGNAAVTGADMALPANGLQNGADGVMIVHCAACTDVATDFPNDTDPTDFPTFTTAGGATATKVDSLAYGSNDSDDTVLMGKLGVTVQYNDSTTESIQRTSLAGFAPATPTPTATGVQP